MWMYDQVTVTVSSANAEALQDSSGTVGHDNSLIMMHLHKELILLTCNSSCVYYRVTRLTRSNNIPSLRHCHHSQLIGGARKETSHIEECLI